MSVAPKQLEGNLPHFPPESDEDQRIRMGCPLDGEDLLHRYREVFSGASPAGWTDDDYLAGYRFEWTLADLAACRACKATEHFKHYPLRGRDDGDEPKQTGDKPLWHEWRDCRTVHGGGYYMDLHRKRTAEEGKPAFVMFNCESVLTRKAEIARRQVDYR